MDWATAKTSLTVTMIVAIPFLFSFFTGNSSLTFMLGYSPPSIPEFFFCTYLFFTRFAFILNFAFPFLIYPFLLSSLFSIQDLAVSL